METLYSDDVFNEKLEEALGSFIPKYNSSYNILDLKSSVEFNKLRLLDNSFDSILRSEKYSSGDKLKLFDDWLAGASVIFKVYSGCILLLDQVKKLVDREIYNDLVVEVV